MKIGIIIPALNESERLSVLLSMIKLRAEVPAELEILVVDASEDNYSQKVCEQYKVDYLKSKKAQRAFQMNIGASKINSEIFYFLHADTIPPKGFDSHIRKGISEAKGGCFRLMFDNENPLLSFYCFFTRFKASIFHGGDASLFLSNELFKKLNGFDEKMDLMEDYDMIKRMKINGNFAVLNHHVTTSARKYNVNGILRLQWIYMVIQGMYHLGLSQDKLMKYYQKHVR